MRRLVVLVLAVVASSVGLVTVEGSLTSSAWACARVGPGGICLDGEVLPPAPPPTEDSPGPGNKPSKCHDIYSGAPTPCTEPNAGVWFGQHNCYAFILEPQPPAGDPMWDGHDPSEGTVWGCDTDFADTRTTFFVVGRPPVVDAAGLALQLVERAPFEVADVRTAPDARFHTYVNVQNWVWVPASQWHEVSVSLTANGATVTLRATPSRLQVDMGDGARPLVCRSAGRAWRTGMTDAATTSCSYAYKKISTVNAAGRYKADGRFTMQGRLYYAVAWTCTGNCSGAAGTLGEFPAPMGAPQQMEVRQRQTVVTR